jgi:hypothetical protein
VEKIRKFMVLVLLLAILVYPLKKHTDIVLDLLSSALLVVKAPLTTINNIFESKELPGFPAGCLEIINSFKEKMPDEKEFYFSDLISADPLASQRMIEYNFPRLNNKSARCGFILNADTLPDLTVKVIDTKGEFKLVCRS